MKQKIIIGFSVILLLLAVFMIARDLFRKSPSYTITSCCGDEDKALKIIDSTLIGYQQIKTIETGIKGLSGITVNNQQQIIVCGNKQVIIYNDNGKIINQFDADSVTNCIATNENNIYVGIGSGISQYSTDGTLKLKWSPFNIDGYITSITADNDYVYTADATNKCILKYNVDGEFIQKIDGKDSLSGTRGFIIPSLYFDIVTGGYNDLWAVNPGYLRLENYSSSGKLRTTWGEASFENNGFSGCCNPAHIALLPDGSFVTYEKGIDKIKVFTPAGEFDCLVAGAGSFKENTDFQLGNNNLVKDLTTDKDGLIYILDAYNRICIFTKDNS